MRHVAIDTETEPIAPGLLIPRLVVLSSAGEGGEPWLVSRHDAVSAAETMLRDPSVILVGHNIAFDLAVLCRAGLDVRIVFAAYDAGRIRDTRIREALDAIACGDLGSREQSLGSIAKARLGVELDKGADGWRLRYGELRDVPLADWPERARAYALDDAATTLRVFRAQGGGRDLPDELPQTRAAWALHLMGAWGVRVDGERLERVRAETQASLDAAHAEARAAGMLRPDGGRDLSRIRAAIEAAHTRAGLRAPRTNRGSIATDAETIAACDDPGLAAVTRIAEAEKILSTYVDAYAAGVDRPLCPSWVPLVSSGRTSCRSPNLQNPPRSGGLRECIVPRAGFAFCSVDYDFLELRTLAQSCLDLVGGSELAAAICAGEDPHLSMGAAILGIPYSEALARRKEPAIKDARQLAKAANFGLPGGMGERNFCSYAHATYGVDLSERRAKDLIAAYHRRWPEVRRLFDLVAGWTRKGSATLTLPRIGRVRGDCGFTDGCNYFFQGPAASGAKEALYRVSRACYAEPSSPLYGSRPVLFLHDEIIAEIPLENLHEAAHEQARIMRETMVEVATPAVPCGASPAAMLRWSKQAEARTDAGGRLIPWEEA